ncbi:hypothetical protein BVRB_027800, partial [Beta vulgaris subsp. vulgaris]
MKCTLVESKSLKGLFPVEVNTDVTEMFEFTCQTKRLDNPKTCSVVQECFLAVKGIALLVDELGKARDVAFNDSDPHHTALLTK